MTTDLHNRMALLLDMEPVLAPELVTRELTAEWYSITISKRSPLVSLTVVDGTLEYEWYFVGCMDEHRSRSEMGEGSQFSLNSDNPRVGLGYPTHFRMRALEGTPTAQLLYFVWSF